MARLHRCAGLLEPLLADYVICAKISYTRIQTNLFCQEQAGLLKQNDKGPSPKLRGPGFGAKLNIAKHLLNS